MSEPSTRHWYAHLSGRPRDLSDLSALSVPDFTVVELENRRFAIDMGEIESSIQPSTVHEQARSVAQLLNGAASLCIDGFEGAKVADIAYKGSGDATVHSCVMLEPIKSTCNVHRIELTVPGQEAKRPACLDETELVLHGATLNNAVETVLRILGRLDLSWRNLFILIELVGNQFGGETALLRQPWAPKEIKDVKAIANNWRLLGVESRHALPKWDEPGKRLTLEQARGVVRELIRGWIGSLK